MNLLLCNELQREEATRSEKDGTKKYLNREFLPVKDEDGIWHCKECYVKITSWKSGKMKLAEISQNTDKRTNVKYPYFARYKKHRRIDQNVYRIAVIYYTSVNHSYLAHSKL